MSEPTMKANYLSALEDINHLTTTVTVCRSDSNMGANKAHALLKDEHDRWTLRQASRIPRVKPVEETPPLGVFVHTSNKTRFGWCEHCKSRKHAAPPNQCWYAPGNQSPFKNEINRSHRHNRVNKRRRGEGDCEIHPHGAHSKEECRMGGKLSQQKSSQEVNVNVVETHPHFLLDSAAQAHVTNISEQLYDSYSIPNLPLTGVNGTATRTVLAGKMDTTSQIGGKIVKIVLKDVLYIPESPHCIIAVQRFETPTTKMTQANNKFLLEDLKTGQVILAGHKKKEDGFYYLLPPPSQILTNKVVHHSFQYWHGVLGHPSDKTIFDLHRRGLIKLSNKIKTKCTICARAKQTQLRAKCFEAKQDFDPSECLNIDINTIPSNSRGCRYVLLITDDGSRYTWEKILKTRENLHIHIDHIVQKILTQHKVRVQRIRTDNEFVTKAITEICDSHGIILEPCPPYEKDYNSISERTNRTVMDKARALLFEAELPRDFSPEAIKTAVFLKNHLPTKGIKTDQIPFEIMHKQSPRFQYLHKFGCEAMATILHGRNKLQSRTEKCIMLGYNLEQNSYKLLSVETGKRIDCASVTFFPNNPNPWPSSKWYKDDESESDSEEEKFEQNPRRSDRIKAKFSHTSSELEEKGSTTDSHPPNPHLKPRRSGRKISPPELLNLNVQTAHTNSLFEPQNFHEAIACEDSTKWKDAMQSELASLRETESYLLCMLPAGRKAISCRWVYKIKMIENKIHRHKARLVARGFMQKFGVDYTETYAPVASLDAIRLICCEAFLRDMTLDQLDIKTAYLYGDLKEEVYMRQPPGFTAPGKKDHVLKLQKSLYGLKQAGKCWYTKLYTFIQEQGYTRCVKDKCVFVKKENGSTTILVVYVDDIIVASDSEEERKSIKDAIGRKFKTHDLGSLNYILGIKVTRTPTTLHFSQAHYAEKILQTFGMEQASRTKVWKYPMLHKQDLSSEPDQPTTDFPFRSALGALSFLCNGTRPDLATSINKLASHSRHPTQKHKVAIKALLRYLRDTKDLGLTFYKENKHPLFACCDSSLMTEPGSKSRTGYCLIRGGAAYIWKTTTEKVPLDNTAEGEYRAVCTCCKALLYARELLNELGLIDLGKPSPIQCDNKSAIFMNDADTNHRGTKHIAAKEMIINHHVEHNNIVVEHIAGKENPSDHFTKALSDPAFPKHRATILGKPNNDQFSLSTKIFP
jgi:hypothetical protein